MVYLFLATGFEEIEALTVVDMMRRVKIDIKTVSVTEELVVTGSHGISVTADLLFEDIKDEADMLVLPGGIPGTLNLKAHDGLSAMIMDYAAKNKYLAAICAAPTIYGGLGLLEGRRATCYPEYEKDLHAKEVLQDAVVQDDRFVTSRGMGTTIDFALHLITLLADEETSAQLAKKIIYTA